jgi:hypothetical protein
MPEFAPPRPLRNSRGELRRVGVELEFGGMTPREAAEAVRAAFGGDIRQDHEHRFAVVTDLGEFEVTYDSYLLSKKPEEAADHSAVEKGAKGAFEWVVRQLGGTVLPLEIGTPPIPADRLDELNRLEQELRARHAEGTRSGVLTAFALHFNPEVPDPTDPGCAAAALRAFLLLYHWLFRAEHIDLTRRLMPFVNPFPEEYTRLVIDPTYAPDATTFTNDYVAHNPTRNRPLDLLPLLAFNDPDLMSRAEVAGQKVRPRPTFHYRLPNSSIDEPGWSIADEWGRWVLVERLADDPELAAQFAAEYLGWEDSILGYIGDRWVRHVEENWLPRLGYEPRPAGRAAEQPA